MRILGLRELSLTLFIAGVFQLNSLAQNARVNIQQDEKIVDLMALKTELTKDSRLNDRYKIQLFYGDNGDANDVITDFRNKYEDMPSIIIYEAPNYKVWVGNFRNRLEADRALAHIKHDFPSAFIPKSQNR